MARRRSAFVPRIIFQTAFVGVIPACVASCAGAVTDDGVSPQDGQSGDVGFGGAAGSRDAGLPPRDAADARDVRQEFCCAVADSGFVPVPGDVADAGFVPRADADASSDRRDSSSVADVGFERRDQFRWRTRGSFHSTASPIAPSAGASASGTPKASVLMAKLTPLQIRRVLTATPLARQHERNLDRPRRRPRIPWQSFRRSDYHDDALSLAFEAQRALATGKYGAVDTFARLASSLALSGAPFDIIAEASRIPSDEIRHADYCCRMAALCGSREVVLTLTGARTSSQLPSDPEHLDRTLVHVSAIGETLAAALLAACRDRATDPVARALFTSIVGDEVHHARLGWYYCAWRGPQWTYRERKRLADSVGELLLGVEQRFWTGRDAPPRARKGARALGVLDSVSQRAVIRHIMEDEIVPALDALGLGASHAWRARRRGGS